VKTRRLSSLPLTMACPPIQTPSRTTLWRRRKLQLGQAARVTQAHPKAPLPGHQTLNMSDRQLRQLKKTPMEDDIPEPEPFGHMPVHSTTKQVCWLCRWSWKFRGEGAPQSVPKPHWACEGCDMPLCLSGMRNCFKEMHELKQVGAFSEGG
jgi:hypothetical protein